MKLKKYKFVTFETTGEVWLALKVEAYKQGKTVKEYLNELLEKVLPIKEEEETEE